MKIYLIGMPGSGKTTLGKQVATDLALEFVDLDQEIEQLEQKAIPQIFEEKGEAYFRKLEAELLQSFATSEKNFVMATGGGAPCFYNGMKVINQSGISIFLDVPMEQLVLRVAKKSNRPLLQTSDSSGLAGQMQKLRMTRLPIYEQATFSLSNPTVAAILQVLKK
jgi:shikimate kinase